MGHNHIGSLHLDYFEDRMQFTDLDWRAIMNDFSDADLIYLKSIIDEKLGHRAKRKALIRKEE